MTATSSLRVHPTNADQLRAWDGDEGAYWAARADDFDRSVRAHHERLLTTAAVRPGDRVLDVGCGTGQVTIDVARVATAGSALGVDLSAAMLDVARHRAEADGLRNVAFDQVDAQVHPFGAAAFDLAVSRTGAMFFGDPVAAFTNIARALRPGGRLVLVTWQSPARNEWFREITTALAAGRQPPAPPAGAPGPFSLSDPERIRDVLGASGYRDVACEGTSADMWFGDDGEGAYGFVLGLLGWMLEGLPDADRARARTALRASTDAHATPAGVLYDSAVWTVEAVRA
jgi:SAM-dependent methyltransferase